MEDIIYNPNWFETDDNSSSLNSIVDAITQQETPKEAEEEPVAAHPNEDESGDNYDLGPFIEALNKTLERIHASSSPVNVSTDEEDFQALFSDDNTPFDWSAYTSSKNSLKESIAMLESGGDYGALPIDKKTGRLVSSAAGKYQILWNTHKDAIRRLTGVASKQEFLQSPDAQELYMDHWLNTEVLPTAEALLPIAQLKHPGTSVEDIAKKIHFSGVGGAKKYYIQDLETRDAFGTTTSTYGRKR